MLLGGCYTRTGMYYESDPRYDEVSVYIDYNFQCTQCYYETYYCINCGFWHTHITHWCHHHHGWYNTWYVVYYYQPYYYYYNHWHSHYYYADYNRHYRHDYNGLRNMGSRNYTKVDGQSRMNNNDLTKDRVKSNENKYPRMNNNKQKQINTVPPVKRNESIKTNPPVKRNNSVKQNSRTNTQIQKRSDSKNNSLRK